ncbi:TPA: hypothetical protein N0F65_007260 [Lagenidium giganteum]|uniref:Uncharacterized protein n=1 Tax=Lagenidium giganteum TaxID=4803 RepID=A0AAV2YZH9_9STRA|nr:TPA: hypothetical protein N0F65_007260 [Lagenidium giganteum]
MFKLLLTIEASPFHIDSFWVK